MSDRSEDAVTTMPLPRFLAMAGVASRRASIRMVASGRVSIGGKTVTEPGRRVDPRTDHVCVDGRPVTVEVVRYILLHKPVGYVCSARDRHASRLALDLLGDSVGERLYSVGRLDRDSEGLLLFTNDGLLAHRLMHPRYEVPRTYEVTVHGKPSPSDLQRLLDGVADAGDRLVATAAECLGGDAGRTRLRVVVREGKKREVRRMCAAIGCRVARLVRVAFGPLVLDDLPPGSWRDLTVPEIAALRRAAGQV
jgi:23S rRNA pseudouridine2605 synthase